MTFHILDVKEFLLGLSIGVLLGTLLIPYDATFTGMGIYISAFLFLAYINIQVTPPELFMYRYNKMQKMDVIVDYPKKI